MTSTLSFCKLSTNRIGFKNNKNIDYATLDIFYSGSRPKSYIERAVRHNWVYLSRRTRCAIVLRLYREFKSTKKEYKRRKFEHDILLLSRGEDIEKKFTSGEDVFCFFRKYPHL